MKQKPNLSHSRFAKGNRKRHGLKRTMAVLLACVMVSAGLLSACGTSSQSSSSQGNSSRAESSVSSPESPADSKAASDTGEDASDLYQRKGAPEINGLTYEGSLKTDYAKQFTLDFYEGGYGLITITGDNDTQKFLVVPKDGEKPDGLAKDITVLQKPFKNIYLAATALMSLFTSMDSLEPVTMTSLKAGDWTFSAPKKAMKEGKISYAGKYSQPDYEMLLANDCDLAIESTMIYHTPEVQEMIEDLKIPVLVDNSSYESNPLGRAEWIKLYAFLTDHEKQADAFFSEQEKKVDSIKDYQNTGKTVAFFYISTDGKAVVRASTDYIPAMIQMAGGNYIFKDLTDADGRTSIDMSIEKFYDTAADADYIIYNGSIDSSVKSLDALLAKDPVMKKFKAVKNGNVWATGTAMYQRPDLAGDMILEIHDVLTKDNPGNLKYLQKLK